MAGVPGSHYTMDSGERGCAFFEMAPVPTRKDDYMKLFWRASIAVGLFAVTSVAEAVAMKKGPPVSSYSTKSSGRDWLISIPVMTERTGELRGHFEYNASRSLGLALEVGSVAANEELSDEEIKELGNSLTIKGLQGSILMSRYSDEANMGGFFWSLGAGYRMWTAEWKKRPDDKETKRVSLVDNDGYLHHRAQGRGTTGHFRGGYRYVASEWPIAIGAHIGIRHMNSQVKDVAVKETEERKMGITYSDLSDKERQQLRYRMMTTPDITVDFGMIF